MATEPERVKQWLLSKWSIVAPVDWLDACLDWLHEEEQGALAVSKVNAQVYEQWLLSDLRQIGALCLPRDLPQTQKTQLIGCFCLQMNSIVDVSSSCYSQLQKLQGTENENVRVTATQLTQTQVKPNRLLMMKLTDGTTDVHGMEYQPIPCLHSTLSPGVKIKIRGPVLCRLGVLMLKRDNVQLLGGEVEELVAENSYQVLLTRALNPDSETGQNPAQRPHPPFPGVAGGGTEGGDCRHSTGKRKAERDRTPPPPRKGSHGISTEMEAVIDMSLDPLSAELLDAMDEEWENDMDQMDDFEQQGHTKVINATTAPVEGRITSMVKTNPCTSTTTPGGYSRHNASSPWQQASASRPQQNVPEMTMLQRDPVKHVRVTPDGCSDIDRKFADRVGTFNNVCAKPLRSPWEVTANTNTEASAQQASVKMEEFIDLTQTEASHETNIDSVSRVRRHNLQCAVGFTASNLGSMASLEGASSTEVKPDLTCPSKSLSSIKDEDSIPYSYLCQIHWPPAQTRIVHIKAYVATLASKLDHGAGAQWSLRAKLNDGSAVVECDLADEMLTSLIGFSAAESLKMRQVAKTDKDVRKRLMAGLTQCQESLIQMSCILDLELSPDRPRPYVLRHRAITAQDWTALQERIGQH